MRHRGLILEGTSISIMAYLPDVGTHRWELPRVPWNRIENVKACHIQQNLGETEALGCIVDTGSPYTPAKTYDLQDPS